MKLKCSQNLLGASDMESCCKQSRPSLTKLERSFVAADRIKITDLPIDLLYRIFDKLNISSHNYIRYASKQMNALHTSYIMHCYRTEMYHSFLPDAPKKMRSVYWLLKLTTEIYLKFGYEPEFCGCLITLHKRISFGCSASYMEKFLQFLLRFYTTIEELVDSELSRTKIQLSYALTLVMLLKQFKSFRFKSCKRKLMHWKLVLEIPGLFLSVLWKNRSLLHCVTNQRWDLIFILCQLHSKDFCEETKNVRSRRTQGLQIVPHRSSRCTIFHFYIQGDDFIKNLFNSVIHDCELPNIPDGVCERYLQISIEIISKCATSITKDYIYLEWPSDLKKQFHTITKLM